MTRIDQYSSPEGDVVAKASRLRDQAVQTIGNLTLLSSSLNSAQSHSAWKDKRPELMKHSLLPINLMLGELPVWDEAAIKKRGEELFAKAQKIWPKQVVAVE